MIDGTTLSITRRTAMTPQDILSQEFEVIGRVCVTTVRWP
jgi:hypothetical protein